MGGQRLNPIRIAVLLGILLCLLRLAEFRMLELVDVRAVDYRLLQRGVQPGAPDIAIVGIDDASIAELGRWPWPRSRLASLIEQLVAADAAVIGFDMVQSEGTAAVNIDGVQTRVSGVDERTWGKIRQALREAANEDAVLATAVRNSGRTVMGYFFGFEKQRGSSDSTPRVSTYNLVKHSRGGVGEARVPAAIAATANLPELTEAARELGYFNFFPDPDGAFRRVPLAIRYGDDLALPLSLAMLRVYRPSAPLAIRFGENYVESVQFGSLAIPVAEDGQMLINYRGPAMTYPHLSAADVLAGRMAPEAVRGKLVLVGVTAHAVTDVRVTPFDGILPGVEIHANVLDNILRQEFIWQPRWVILVELGVMVLTVLILGAVLQYARGIMGVVSAAAALAAYLIGSQELFVSYGLPLSLVYPVLTIFLTYTGISIDHYMTEEREKRKNRTALELYLSPALARLLSEQPAMLKLGGEKRECTVLFSDIRGFTTISERLDPEALVELLNVYLGEMTDIIFAHDGMLDKYVGDAIMAVWGAPLPQSDHAARAAAAALRMINRLHELQRDWRERGWPALEIGIGLNTGPMVFGNMGSAQHLSLTVIGDNVNLGSRLEGLSKFYGASIIASGTTVGEAGDLVARELDLVRVKGKVQPVRIFELLAPAGDGEPWSLLVERFNAGLCAYRQQRWDEAVAAFQAVLEARPGDGPATLYLERCRAMAAAPPPADWDGVAVMEAK